MHIVAGNVRYYVLALSFHVELTAFLHAELSSVFDFGRPRLKQLVAWESGNQEFLEALKLHHTIAEHQTGWQRQIGLPRALALLDAVCSISYVQSHVCRWKLTRVLRHRQMRSSASQTRRTAPRQPSNQLEWQRTREKTVY